MSFSLCPILFKFIVVQQLRPSFFAIAPSSKPQNLHYSTATGLDWDPPQNNGGVTITNYLIIVNGYLEVGSNITNVILELNSTGQHLIEISAVNGCGLVSNNASIDVSGMVLNEARFLGGRTGNP